MNVLSLNDLLVLVVENNIGPSAVTHEKKTMPKFHGVAYEIENNNCIINTIRNFAVFLVYFIVLIITILVWLT